LGDFKGAKNFIALALFDDVVVGNPSSDVCKLSSDVCKLSSDVCKLSSVLDTSTAGGAFRGDVAFNPLTQDFCTSPTKNLALSL
jgi:hypothetical protein